MRFTKLSPFLFLSVLSLSAYGSTILGDPDVSVHLVAGPATTLNQLEAKDCASGVTTVVPIHSKVTASSPVDVTLPVGVFCAIGLEIESSGGPLLVDVSGFSTLDVDDGNPAVAILLNANLETAALIEL